MKWTDGLACATTFCLIFTASAHSYDMKYHQDIENLVIDGKFALLPNYELKMLSKIKARLKGKRLAGHELFVVKIDQNGRVMDVNVIRSSNRMKDQTAASAAIAPLLFGPIPFGKGPRTLSVQFTLEELATAPVRNNVSIVAGKETRDKKVPLTPIRPTLTKVSSVRSAILMN